MKLVFGNFKIACCCSISFSTSLTISSHLSITNKNKTMNISNMHFFLFLHAITLQYPLFELVPPGIAEYVPEFDSAQLIRQQQLPLQQTHKPFHVPQQQQQKQQQTPPSTSTSTQATKPATSSNNSKWTQLKNASKFNEKSSSASANALGSNKLR